MTFCLAMKLKDGLVAIADTRLTSGNETTTAKKIFKYEQSKHSLFILTSGLRSVRDKAITYFDEDIEENFQKYNKLYKAVNAFAKQLRRVADEDKQILRESGYDFNLNSIIGGQLENDAEPKLYLVYPQGNWVEIGEASPFVIIGNSGYGKPILNRVVKYESSLKFALKCGFLSFDSTRKSANDVDFPIDVMLYKNDSFEINEHRFEKEDLTEVSQLWGSMLSESVKIIPEDWMSSIIKD